MTTSITQSSRFVAMAVAATMIAAVVFGGFTAPAHAALSESQISSIISLLQSFGADQATINNVSASLHGQASPGTGTGSGGACPALTRDLQQGSTGADVLSLQKFLNTMTGTMIASSGAGSPGNETQYFGGLTKAAVIKFQTLYNITPIAGYAGAKTRAQIAAVCGGTSSVPGTPAPTGPGLTISTGVQPANALAPQGATRVPFTTFTLTNNTGAAVTVNNVTVQRTGLAVDTNFSGIILLDSNGLQIGTAKTLNSNHQASIGDAFTIGAGQSMTLTVAGNIATVSNVAGQIVSLQVVAINTSAPVSGSLPINGASHTINIGLTLGSVSTTTSSFDPGATQTKNIGDVNVRIAGLRFTAGSVEDLKLYNIRWRQVGTASNADLANIITVVNGTSYPATVDSSGRYYTTIFPGGLLITKGNSIDAYIQADFIGSNSASRTVDFDIDKVTDVYFVGQTYGYGVAPSGTYTPWYTGYATTINAGTVTTIGNAAAEVPSQNVAVNVSNQPLGGIVTDFKGEAVSITSMIVNLGYSGAVSATTYPITSVSLVDANGTVVAGPIDAVVVSGPTQRVTFTDTVTFPTGRHVYTIKGKIASGVTANTTVTASTTPSGWGSPTGQTSGNSVTISTANFAMNAMTIKAAALSITVSPTPASHTVIVGTTNVLFANIQLDASQSGEDVRLSSLPIIMTLGGTSGAVADITSCQLFNGATAVNTGSNVPALAADTTATTFTLDNSLTIPKGTIVTLALKCNVSSGAASTATYTFSISSASTYSATGSSGTSVTVAATTGSSGTMSVGSASLAVILDPSSPGYAIAAAGSTGVTLGAYKFTATNDAINLTRVGLNLGTITASSTAADLTQIYLYNGATLVGTATFTGANRSATSTLSTPVAIPANGSVTLTVKADLAPQGFSLPSHPGALLTVNVDVNGATGNGNTLGSGTGGNVNASGSTAVTGVRVFRGYPVVAQPAQASSVLVNQSSTDQELYRFSVAAVGNDVALDQFSINIATSSGSNANGTTSVTSLKVFGYTDSALSNSVPGAYTSAQVVATVTDLISSGNTTATISPILIVPKGVTYYFKVTGRVAQVSGTTANKGTVTTRLVGDTSYPAFVTELMGSTTGVISDMLNASKFVWSPMSTSTSAATANMDWTNGFSVPGLPSGGTNGNTLTN